MRDATVNFELYAGGGTQVPKRHHDTWLERTPGRDRSPSRIYSQHVTFRTVIEGTAALHRSFIVSYKVFQSRGL